MPAASLPLASETEQQLACELSGVTKAFANFVTGRLVHCLLGRDATTNAAKQSTVEIRNR